jgi:hypothetical protein
VFEIHNKKEIEMKLVIVGKGKSTHLAKDFNGTLRTLCGAEKCSTGNRRFSSVRVDYYASEPTCKKCLEIKDAN